MPVSLVYPSPGAPERPIGNIRLFLEDIRQRGFKCRGIIDVGANLGDWSRMALSIYPNAKVLLIEPQSELAGKLGILQQEYRNVEYLVAGAGSEECELVQTVYDDHRGSTFLPNLDQTLLRSGKQRLTKVVTLDGLLRERDFHPDLVKLDIQGYEIEALKGASSCFGRTEVFIVETSLYRFYDAMPMTREVIQFMSDKGYELYDVTEFLRRPYDGALGQIDLAFVKRTGFLRTFNRWA